MKSGKVTAKLRDAVKVHFVEEGHAESGRIYKNIEIPDELKVLELKDFEFLIMGDKIEFELTFKKDTFHPTLPDNRPKITRAEKAAARVLAEAKALQHEAIPAKEKAVATAPKNTGSGKPAASTKQIIDGSRTY